MWYNVCQYIGETRAVQKKLSIRITAKLYQAGLDKARRSRTTLSQVIRWFLERWVRGEIEAVPPKGEEVSE